MIDETKKKLDAISPTMCIAKWKQSTIHLHNGHTHSCHHPSVHKIPEELLKDNPGVIHNTPHKIEARQQMLDGVRPKECDYCWNIEDTTDQPSDRILKSSYSWSNKYFDEVQENLEVNPSNLEISFDHTCNLKCAYCSPVVSSKWAEEIKQHGPYPTSNNFNDIEFFRSIDRMPIDRNKNPYVDAFWDWFPEAYNDLDVLRVTGGEPLLSKNLWKLFDYFNEHPRNDLRFAVNTNLSVPDDLIDRFINEINNTNTQMEIYTSAEATGEQCDYIRYGMDYGKFMHNVSRILKETSATVIFMCTVNILSCTTLDMLIRQIIAFKERYGTDRVSFSLPYLRYPDFLDIRILPDDMKDKFAFSLYAIQDDLLSEAELTQMTRLQQFVMNSNMADINRLQNDFKSFIIEYDKRRNVNFVDVFPELKDLL